MATEWEIFKLVGILAVGARCISVGLYFHHKQMDEKSGQRHIYKPSKITTTSFSPGLSSEEESAKNYIQNYKNRYSKESIKIALVKTGIDEAHANYWIKKYS